MLKDFTLAPGKRLSLYSREGTKLYSSQHDIDIQAQGGNITTWSTEDTHISSGRKMVVTAQDELTLICGGGYTKIKGGNVEIGGPGRLLIKNNGIRKAGSGRMQGAMKSSELSTFDEKFVIRNTLTKEPIPGKAYKITMPDGYVVSGITDASGATSLNSSDVIDDMIISLVKAN
ncbi:DUF2345 domain-containing protein [Pantoea anthophila]|nr:DUF2345 domain-containing protein [Pantoea anthophila]